MTRFAKLSVDAFVEEEDGGSLKIEVKHPEFGGEVKLMPSEKWKLRDFLNGEE